MPREVEGVDAATTWLQLVNERRTALKNVWIQCDVSGLEKVRRFIAEGNAIG
jgi:hypothetical protein